MAVPPRPRCGHVMASGKTCMRPENHTGWHHSQTREYSQEYRTANRAKINAAKRAEYRRRKYRRMTEDELFETVTKMCDAKGLWWWHDNKPEENKPGLPDLLIVGRHRSVWRELKSQDGRHSMQQIRVSDRLRRAGNDYATWRPEDLDTGKIAAELEGLRR